VDMDRAPVPRGGQDSGGRRPLNRHELVWGVAFFALVWSATGVAAILLIWLLQLAGVWAVPETSVEPGASAVVGSLATRFGRAPDGA
jgi:hypothetical protein